MAVSVAFCIFMRKCAMLGVRSGRGQGSGADAELLGWGWFGLRLRLTRFEAGGVESAPKGKDKVGNWVRGT